MNDIKVQVVQPDTGAVAFRPKLLPSFDQRAEELGGALNDIATRIGKRVRALEDDGDGWGLEEVALTFSLDLQAETGVIIARASSKAGFQATLTWQRTRRQGSK